MRTWGFRPDDWHDDFFTIEVRFERPPTDAECRVLGQRWSRFRSSEGRGPWSFAGPFALVDVTPRTSGSSRDALSAFGDFLAESKPSVVEAIACNVITKEAEWKQLAPGPKFTGSMRPVDKKLPELSGRPAFVEGMNSAVERRRQAEKKQLLDAVANQPVSLEEIPWPETRTHSAAMRKLFDQMRRFPDQAEQFWVLNHKLPKVPAGFSARYESVFVSRGARALLGANQEPPSGFEGKGPTAVLEVGMKKPWKPRAVWRVPAADQWIKSMGWLDERTMVATTAKRLVVLDVGSGEELASLKQRLGTLITALGRVVICDDSKGCHAYGWKDGKLTQLATFPGASVHGEGDPPIVEIRAICFRVRGL